MNITTQYPESARYFAISMTRLLQSLAFYGAPFSALMVWENEAKTATVLAQATQAPPLFYDNEYFIYLL